MAGVQATRPRAIVDLIHSAENFRIELGSEGNLPQPKKCERCGYICSQSVCKACQLLEGLNKGLPSMGISRLRQVKSRTATKLAAEKLRAAAATDVEQDETSVRTCEKSGCACAKSHTVPAAQDIETVTDGATAVASRNGMNESLDAADLCGGQHSTTECTCNGGQGAAQQHQDAVQHAGDTKGAAHCDCAAASLKGDGAVCASDEDWTLPSNFTEASDVRNAQSVDPAIEVAALSLGSTDTGPDKEAPVRVHGKLYESNLRKVDAHPSARRPVPADFGTSW